MELKHLIKLGVQNLTHNLSETLYLKTGYDLTKPRSIQGIVNERCNYKCRYCHFWRLEEYQDEMSISQWQAALLSLKELVGFYVIQFAGGEPFIKKGFVDLLEFCHLEGIHWGVITNGSAFNRQTVKRVVGAHPVNIDISVDSPRSEVHDFVRGMPGSLAKIAQGIEFLREERQRRNLKFPIRIKPTVHQYNFRHLPELVEWTQRIGATTVDFSPVKARSPEQKRELWISTASDLESLQQTIETLVGMKNEGAPIETSEQKLRSFLDHFRGQPVQYGVLPCRLSLRDYHIRSNGEVRMCGLYSSLGNVKTSSARDIWYSDETRRIRAQMVGCHLLGKPGCANFCLASQVPLKQQVQRGLLMFRRVGSE